MNQRSKSFFLILFAYFGFATSCGLAETLDLNTTQPSSRTAQSVIKASVTYNKIQDKDYESRLSKSDTLVLELQAALNMALDKNLSLEIQEYNLKQAQDRLLGSVGAFLPSVSLIQDITRRDGHIQLFGDQTIPVVQDTLQPRAETRFSFFQGGRVLFGWLASKKQLENQKKLLENSQQATLGNVAKTYFELQTLIQELDAETERLEQAELNSNQRRKALELGDDIKLSVLLAEQELQLAKARISFLKASFYTASSKLNELLNLPNGTLIVPVLQDLSAPIVTFAQNTNLEKLISYSQINNPQLAAKDFQVSALKEEQNKSLSYFMPELGVQLSNGFIGSQYSNLVGNNIYNFYARYDLFKDLGVSSVARYRQAKHLAQQSKTEQTLMTKQLDQTITSDYLQVIATRDSLNAAEALYEAATEGNRQAKARFDAGVGTIYEVKVSLADLASARANYFVSLGKYRKSQIDLLQNLGALDIDALVRGREF